MKKILITLVAIIVLGTGTVFGAKFSDTNGHWAEKVVDEMAIKGILNGFGDGTFKPNNSVTREQFAKILVESLDIEEKGSNVVFQDVEEGRWSRDYIERASKYLTIGKTNDGRRYFMPTEYAIREEVATAVVKASGLENEIPNYDLLKQFSDNGKITNEYRKYIAIAIEHGIMKGKGGYFDPQGGLTRAESCQLIYNIYNSKEEISFENNDKLYQAVKKSLEESKIDFEYNDTKKLISVNINKVKELKLKDGEIKNIQQISNFKHLRKLKLSNNKIKDITPLEELIYLEELNLDDNEINNINSLSELININTLSLQNNKIEDLEPISKLTKLEILSLTGNNIKNIDDLSNLKKLISLDLNNNDIENIEPLKKMTKLYALTLNANEIQNIDVLKNFKELGILYMSDNHIDNIEVLGNLKNLYSVYLNNNHISDMSAVEDFKLDIFSKFEKQTINEKIQTTDEQIELFPLFKNQELTLNTTGTVIAHLNNNQIIFENASNGDTITLKIIDGKYRESIVTYTLKGKSMVVNDREEKDILYGDVNGDGIIEYHDGNLLAKDPEHLENMGEQIIFENADVNLDGKIDDTDQFFINQRVEGKLDLPHKCSSIATKYVTVNYNCHDIITKCYCGEAYAKTNAIHRFEDGICVCGFKENMDDEKILYGDANNDGIVNLRDYEALIHNEVINLKNADVNLDGEVNHIDTALVRMSKEVGLSPFTSLPHTCGTCKITFERINNERHTIMVSCDCLGEIMGINTYHTFIKNKCECGEEK